MDPTDGTGTAPFWKQLLYAGLIVSLVFSFRYPLPDSISIYASINSEDLFIALVTVALIAEAIRYRDWSIRLAFPRVTAALLLVSVWLIVTIFVAHLRSPFPVTGNMLWLLKWFEAIVLFVVLQDQVDGAIARVMVRTLLVSAAVLAVAAAIMDQISPVYRIELFWVNPNTLAVFFSLATLIGIGSILYDDYQFASSWLLYATTGCTLYGLLLTGSRGGFLAFGSGLLILAIFSTEIVDPVRLIGGSIAAVGTGVGSLALVAPDIFQRFIIWFKFDGLRPVAVGPNSSAINARIDFTIRGLRLFAEYPIFGYGWMASAPENPKVGVLDVLYTSLLVDIGVVGFLLMLGLYALYLGGWFRHRRGAGMAFSTASMAWFAGVLVGSVGASHPRVPRIMFLTMILLAVSGALAGADRTSIVGTPLAAGSRPEHTSSATSD